MNMLRLWPSFSEWLSKYLLVTISKSLHRKAGLFRILGDFSFIRGRLSLVAQC